MITMRSVHFNFPSFSDSKKKAETDVCLKDKIYNAACSENMKERVTNLKNLVESLTKGCGLAPKWKCDDIGARETLREVSQVLAAGDLGQACM